MTDPRTDPTADASPVAPTPSDPAGDADFAVLGEPRRVHVIAIGGAGMSAIAGILASIGHQVSGSDQAPSAVLDRLRTQGIDARVGHDAGAIVAGIDLVTRSTAVGDDNPEVVAARALGIPVWSRAQILAAIATTRRTMAVAGTHGKTTTSSMLALVLIEAGLDPSFIIGSDVLELGTGATWGSGDLFVMEADESDGTFVTLSRSISIVTNVEADHLEHWGGFEALEASFVEFVAGTDGPSVVCADDPGALALASSPNAVTYGTHPDADYRMDDLATDPRRRLVHPRAPRRRGRRGARHDLAPCPGLTTTPATPRRPPWRPCCPARRSRPRRTPSVASVASPGGSSAGARSAASPSSTATTTCAPRCRRCSRRPERATGAGSCACSSRTATAAPSRSGPPSPTPSTWPTSS